MTEHSRTLVLTVNGEEVRETVEARTTLVDFLRERLGLTGSHVGCEQGVCGACTVRLDGITVRGCLTLAVQCAGSTVETIEGVSDAGEIADLQEAFVRRNALQCGFCTPGILLSAQELLACRERRGGVPSREAIRAHLSGNYCRCTGYQAIVDAVEAVAKARLGERARRSSPSPSSFSSPSPSSGRAGAGSRSRHGRADDPHPTSLRQDTFLCTLPEDGEGLKTRPTLRPGLSARALTTTLPHNGSTKGEGEDQAARPRSGPSGTAGAAP